MVIRKSLTMHRGHKNLDMEKIYAQLDSGRTVQDVANEWGVSRSTLYRRHREYQKEAELMEKSTELPDMPEAFRDEFYRNED